MLGHRLRNVVGEIDILSVFERTIYINEVKYRGRKLDCLNVLAFKIKPHHLMQVYNMWLQNNHIYETYPVILQYFGWHDVNKHILHVCTA